jgi:alanyl-tRNA synthetase
MGAWPGSGKGADGATYSLELCGGTHVGRTGDIGAFAIVQDSASSSGVRRVEALTGQVAFDWLEEQADAFNALRGLLKAQGVEDAKAKQAALIAENRSLANELAQLKRELAMAGGKGAVPTDAKVINGISFKAQVLSGVTGKDLPGLVDEIKAQIGSGAVLLITDNNGKAAVAAGVTADLTPRLSAVDILKAVVAALGGIGGGGRPDMAQGGAPSLAQANQAIAAAEAVIAGVK